MPTKSSKTRDLVGHVVRSQERRERGQKDAVLRGVNILGLTFFPSVPVSIKTLSLSLSLSLSSSYSFCRVSYSPLTLLLQRNQAKLLVIALLALVIMLGGCVGILIAAVLLNEGIMGVPIPAEIIRRATRMAFISMFGKSCLILYFPYLKSSKNGGGVSQVSMVLTCPACLFILLGVAVTVVGVLVHASGATEDPSARRLEV